MTQCEQIEPLLTGFVDGELVPPQMQAVARHLAACPKCESVLIEFSAVGERLREVAGEFQLEGFTQSVMAKLPRPTPIRDRLRSFLDLFNERLIAGTALVAATLAIGAWTMILVTPMARVLMARARADKSAVVASAKAEVHGIDNATRVAAVTHRSQAVISRLESQLPNVAVWSEPDTEATVIWVPDRR